MSDLSSQDHLKPGDLIHDRYEIISILGEGGMGVVYKVKDTFLSRVVALKTLLPAFVEHKEFLTRFINEAKVCLTLTHENIIRVYDIQKYRSYYYMTMTFIEGISLSDWMKRNRNNRDVGIVLDILKKICNGLDYAHQQGTFHRDIKPGNIMLTNDGRVILVDFGLAKLADNIGDLTRVGVAGTPNYMAPEQKHRTGEIDHRIDIYAVGVMAFEMFTGQLPKLTMASQLNPKLDARVDEVLIKALANNPADRYSNIQTFMSELEDAFKVKTIVPQPVSAPDDTPTVPEAVEKDTAGPEKPSETPPPETPEPQPAAVAPEPTPPPTQDSMPDMIMVQAGHFWMGSRPDESRNISEKPRHRVYLATYYIDKYPVTNQSYGRFVKETGHRPPAFHDDPQLNHPLQPVVGVSWDDAVAFAKWSGKRLPTEAEWEKAAKGEDGLIYPWGNDYVQGMANVDFAMANPSRIRQFAGNVSPCGCFDMIGNVWEWCADWYDEAYYAGSPKENPQGPGRGSKKVLRGGAWDTIYLNARNAFRFYADRDSRNPNIGFRCVYDM